MEIKSSRNNRGFNIFEFTDRSGSECSLQESSLATEAAIWFGCSSPDAKIMTEDGWKRYELAPGTQINTRMHLTQDQVCALLPALVHFAATGQLPEDPKQISKASLLDFALADRKGILTELIHNGQMASNVCFAIKQMDGVDQRTRDTAKEAQDAWDKSFKAWHTSPSAMKGSAG